MAEADRARREDAALTSGADPTEITAIVRERSPHANHTMAGLRWSTSPPERSLVAGCGREKTRAQPGASGPQQGRSMGPSSAGRVRGIALSGITWRRFERSLAPATGESDRDDENAQQENTNGHGAAAARDGRSRSKGA
jgi:hypothetical protein